MCLDMLRFISLLLVLLFIISCNSVQEPKEETPEEIPDKIVVDQPQENKSSQWIGQGGDTPKADTARRKVDKSKFKSSNEKTPEQKKRDLEIRQARTSFKNGVEYYKLGEIDNAILEFKESLMYDHNNAPANFNLGKIYHDTGQNDLSLSYYHDAVSINPDDTNSIVSIGLIYFEEAVYDSAMKYFNIVIEKAPSFGLAYYNRGTLLGQNKYYEQSIDDLNKAAKFSPNDSRVFMNRGLVYYYSKDMASACEDWNKAATMGNLEATKAVSIYCNEKSR